MRAGFEQLIDVLREELVLYGEALALLEHQRDLVVRCAGVELLENVEEISAQFQRIAVLRAQRENLRRDLAAIQHKPISSSIHELIQEASTNYRPLLEALVEEINDLLVRSQDRLLGNNLLLRRRLVNELRAPSVSLGIELADRPKRGVAQIGCRTKLVRLISSRCSVIANDLPNRKKLEFHPGRSAT